MKIKNYNIPIPHPHKDNIKTADHCGTFVKNKIIKAKITKRVSSKFFKEDSIIGL